MFIWETTHGKTLPQLWGLVAIALALALALGTASPVLADSSTDQILPAEGAIED